MFNYGIPFQQFYDTAQDRYKNYANNAIKNYSNLEAYLEKVKCITSKFYILAVGENWCIDSILNIPVIHWLEKNNENTTLKIIDTENYRKFIPNKNVTTPTLIIMDKSYKEIGRWIQYPQSILNIVESKDQSKIIVEKRRYRRGEYITDTMEEVLNILLNYKG